MTKKIAFFAFNGAPLCFMHVLLNALDMKEKGYEVKIIFEGGTVKLIKDFSKPDNPFHKLYMRAKNAGLIDCVCKACAVKMDSLEAAETQGLPIDDELSGHPGMAKYIEQGYEVMVF